MRISKDFHLYGFAYETGIHELVIDSIDEYITQIEIPVKSESQGNNFYCL